MPKNRSLVARAAAHKLHSLYDSKELTAPGRRAFLNRFRDQVDPERKLPEAERERRAAHALQAHMLWLAARSAEARRKRQ